MKLDELYREVILRHYKHPLNFGSLEPPVITTPGINPACGDQLKLYLRLDGNRIAEVRWEGEGCAISMASASLMSELVKGKPIEEALELERGFKAMIVDGVTPAPELGDLAALAGVHKLPARVKCATLAWNTLEEALKTSQTSVDLPSH